MPLDPDDVEACPRVAAAVDDAGERVVAAVGKAYRARKQRRTAERRAATGEHDRRLVTQPRTGDPARPPDPQGAEVLPRARRRYACESPCREVPPSYPQMCAECATSTTARRHAGADLPGRRALLTGIHVTGARPHTTREALRERGFPVPLDAVDGTARVHDPIVPGVHDVFLEDYRAVQW
ncbi:hypothetical protein ACQP2P_36755 [Dactylosporangium sp. CA-139114]|uniref:hypothetical protein n=1 Tax=Dactylosporangium sp. CA-139114 TaxID=3239931 RepID=UPI003D99D671